jgi:hypothetical protein
MRTGMCESRVGIVRASGRTPTTSIPSSEYKHTRGTRSHAHRPGFRLYTTTAVREPWYCQHTANILPTLALRVTDAGVMIVHGTERQSTTDQTDLTPIRNRRFRSRWGRVCELRIKYKCSPLPLKGQTWRVPLRRYRMGNYVRAAPATTCSADYADCRRGPNKY